MISLNFKGSKSVAIPAARRSQARRDPADTHYSVSVKETSKPRFSWTRKCPAEKIPAKLRRDKSDVPAPHGRGVNDAQTKAVKSQGDRPNRPRPPATSHSCRTRSFRRIGGRSKRFRMAFAGRRTGNSRRPQLRARTRRACSRRSSAGNPKKRPRRDGTERCSQPTPLIADETFLTDRAVGRPVAGLPEDFAQRESCRPSVRLRKDRKERQVPLFGGHRLRGGELRAVHKRRQE